MLVSEKGEPLHVREVESKSHVIAAAVGRRERRIVDDGFFMVGLIDLPQAVECCDLLIREMCCCCCVKFDESELEFGINFKILAMHL